MTIYVDESGNGGLLDNDQPVFALSAIAIEEDEAHRLKEEYLPKALIGSGELKHDSLSKRTRNGVQERLGELQGVLLHDYLSFSYVFVKVFYLIEKMVMDCTPGEGASWDYLQMQALEIYRQFDEISKKCDFRKVLKAYERAIGLKTDDKKYQEAFDRFVREASAAVGLCPALQAILGGIASRNHDCVEEFMCSSGKNVHAPMLVGLVNKIFKVDQSNIKIICDDSPQFEGVEEVFCGFPIASHIVDLGKGRSDDYVGLQLADILAGGARYVGERLMLGLDRGKKVEKYIDRLVAIYDRENRLLCQPPAFPIPMYARICEVSRWFEKRV